MIDTQGEFYDGIRNGPCRPIVGIPLRGGGRCRLGGCSFVAGVRSLALCPDGPLRFVGAPWPSPPMVGCGLAVPSGPLSCMTCAFRLGHLAPGCDGLQRPLCADCVCVCVPPFLGPFVRPVVAHPMALDRFGCRLGALLLARAPCVRAWLRPPSKHATKMGPFMCACLAALLVCVFVCVLASASLCVCVCVFDGVRFGQVGSDCDMSPRRARGIRIIATAHPHLSEPWHLAGRAASTSPARQRPSAAPKNARPVPPPPARPATSTRCWPNRPRNSRRRSTAALAARRRRLSNGVWGWGGVGK